MNGWYDHVSWHTAESLPWGGHTSIALHGTGQGMFAGLCHHRADSTHSSRCVCWGVFLRLQKSSFLHADALSSSVFHVMSYLGTKPRFGAICHCFMSYLGTKPRFGAICHCFTSYMGTKDHCLSQFHYQVAFYCCFRSLLVTVSLSGGFYCCFGSLFVTNSFIIRWLSTAVSDHCLSQFHYQAAFYCCFRSLFVTVSLSGDFLLLFKITICHSFSIRWLSTAVVLYSYMSA